MKPIPIKAVEKCFKKLTSGDEEVIKAFSSFCTEEAVLAEYLKDAIDKTKNENDKGIILFGVLVSFQAFIQAYSALAPTDQRTLKRVIKANRSLFDVLRQNPSWGGAVSWMIDHPQSELIIFVVGGVIESAKNRSEKNMTRMIETLKTVVDCLQIAAGANISPAEPEKPKQSNNVYTLHLTLDYTEPPVWRRFQVAGEVTLNELHQILQTVMGWGNYHMHEFRIGKKEYGENFEEQGLPGLADPTADSDVTLESLISRKGEKFKYIYDFGDDWIHTLKVEKIEPRKKGDKPPLCLDGERACPPEDCGSVPGYQNILEMLGRRAHRKDDEEMRLREWVGDYDPAAFDLPSINRALAPFRKRAVSR